MRCHLSQGRLGHRPSEKYVLGRCPSHPHRNKKPGHSEIEEARHREFTAATVPQH